MLSIYPRNDQVVKKGIITRGDYQEITILVLTGEMTFITITSYLKRTETVLKRIQVDAPNKQTAIEEHRSKLRGMFCRAAVLRIDRKEFCLI